MPKNKGANASVYKEVSYSPNKARDIIEPRVLAVPVTATIRELACSSDCILTEYVPASTWLSYSSSIVSETMLYSSASLASDC